MYPVEQLDPEQDNGTMPDSLAALSAAVVGRKIASADKRGGEFVITLDSGARVIMDGVSDCCAYSDVEAFLLHPERVDHVITGVGTTGEYTTWHVYADLGDVLELTVGWSAGNPFYYGYGFDITIKGPA